MKISVVNLTCDRPVGFALCERWMARQTRKPDEWIVVDGGRVQVTCTMGQTHIANNHTPPGVGNFLSNIRAGVEASLGDVILFIEDDDCYRADHIENSAKRLESHDIVGGIWQPYYNVNERLWKMFRNRGSALCQTGIRRTLMPMLINVLGRCATRGSFGVDGNLWDMAKAAKLRVDEYDDTPVIGIKGLPGNVGLGVGHRPTRAKGWAFDPKCIKLQEWVGKEDAQVYMPMYQNRKPVAG